MGVEVLLRESLGRAGKPGFNDQLFKLIMGYAIQTYEDRRVAVEMWRGEEDARIVRKQRFLGAEVLYPRSEDGSGGGIFAQGLKVHGAKRSLPHESPLAHAPESMIAREPLSGLRQRERDLTHILPASHAFTLAAASRRA